MRARWLNLPPHLVCTPLATPRGAMPSSWLLCSRLLIPCFTPLVLLSHPSPPHPPLQCYDEFLARTLADLQPPSKKRRTDSRL